MDEKNQPATGTEQVAKEHSLTVHEKRALEAHLIKQVKQRPAPRLKVLDEKGGRKVTVEHPDTYNGGQLMLASLGSVKTPVANDLITHCARLATSNGKIDEEKLNSLIGFVQGIEPQNTVETALAAQMAAIHDNVMLFARRLAHADTISESDSAERTLNRLARTFTAQVEALKKYRSSGEQVVRVERVNVSEGGQAIVGNVQR